MIKTILADAARMVPTADVGLFACPPGHFLDETFFCSSCFVPGPLHKTWHLPGMLRPPGLSMCEPGSSAFRAVTASRQGHSASQVSVLGRIHGGSTARRTKNGTDYGAEVPD